MSLVQLYIRRINLYVSEKIIALVQAQDGSGLSLRGISGMDLTDSWFVQWAGLSEWQVGTQQSEVMEGKR